jgi:hypothetical protein
VEPTFSTHATHRAQQRGIPRLISHWLLDYGEEHFDGRGGIVCYFTPNSIRKMERDFGREPLKRLSEYLRCYLVMSTDGDTVITVGKRYKNKRASSFAS